MLKSSNLRISSMVLFTIALLSYILLSNEDVSGQKDNQAYVAFAESKSISVKNLRELFSKTTVSTDVPKSATANKNNKGSISPILPSKNTELVALPPNTGPDDDFDGDGVLNKNDLDDDNDGVLDREEQSNACYLSGSEDLRTLTFTNDAGVPLQKTRSSITASATASAFRSTYSNKTYNLPVYLEFKTSLQGSTAAMIGLIAENATENNNSNNDAGYKLYFFTNGTFYVQKSNSNIYTGSYTGSDKISMEISAAGLLTVKKNTISVYTTTIATTLRVAQQLVLTNFGSTTRTYENLSLNTKTNLGTDVVCDDLDTDNDTIFNRFDLDSDGDGCSDAFEAGATADLTTNYQFTGSTGSNGLINTKETTPESGTINYTSTYTLFALRSDLKSCADTDGDGIIDRVDIDDDNDGVLDTVENSVCAVSGFTAPQSDAATWPYASGKILTIGGNTNGLGFKESGFEKEVYSRGTATFLRESPNRTASTTGTFANGTIALTDISNTHGLVTMSNNTTEDSRYSGSNDTKGIDVAPVSGPLNSTNNYKYTITINFNSSSIINSFGFDLVDILDATDVDGANMSYLVYVDGQLAWQVSNLLLGAGNTKSVPIKDGNGITRTNQVTGQNLENFIGIVQDHPLNQIKIEVEMKGSSGKTSYNDLHGLDNFVSATTLICDTDGDGIANHLDLDSDNDDASDRCEAGVSDLSGANLNSDGNTVDGSYGANGFSNSLETSAESGVYKGTYTYANATNGTATATCLDSDEDGILDLNDVCNGYDDKADVDNDGIPDACDLDDDNDGILDTDETTNCRYINPIDISSVDFDNNPNLTLTKSTNSLNIIRNSGDWVSTYSTRLLRLPVLLKFKTNDTNTNMIGLIPSDGTKTPAGWNDSAFKFNFRTSSAVDIRAAGDRGVEVNYTPTDEFSIEINQRGELTMSKNGTPIYTTIVTKQYYQLALSTRTSAQKDYNDIFLSETYHCDDIDTDGDETVDRLDLDSDNDGIPDNVEAQTTKDYVPPSGQGNGITDANNNGLDDNYEAAEGGTDIIPVNTDATAPTIDTIPDYLDSDSDNDGINDTIEAGYTVAGNTNDTDGDGILDAYDDVNGADVNDDINDPNPSNLLDSDKDLGPTAEFAIPLQHDLDYRDNELFESFDGCSEEVYLSQGAVSGPNPSVALYDLQTDTNPFTIADIGNDTHGINYNAIGFNPVDQFIYGMERNSNTVVKIDKNGKTVRFANIPSLPNSSNFFSGEIDDTGNYYVMEHNSDQFVMIDLITFTYTATTLTSQVIVPDIAYSVTTGLFYGVQAGNSGDAGKLVSINPTTNVVQYIGASNDLKDFGSMYASVTGEIFGNRNDGGFYQFDLDTGERVKISDSSSATSNDGAHCVTAPIALGADLAITKTDGEDTYNPNLVNSFTYTITVLNEGPYGVLNAAVKDPVPTGINPADVSYTVTVETGSTSNVVGTQTGAIDDLVDLEVNSKVIYTVNVTVPATFRGDLVNIATVTNPPNVADDHLDDNTATDTNTPKVNTIITNRRITKRVKGN